MGLHICSLNSGSNANCYYIGNGEAAVLVDAGLSCRETERRMAKAGLDIRRVQAIFISHEHIDHVTGLPALSKKYRLPVYITPATLAGARLPVEAELVRGFTTHQPVQLGGLTVQAFSKHHDAADPYSFVITGNGVHVGVFTDIGHACAEVIRYFKQCHAVFLEANYCETMLANGAYPVFLKQRISSKKGHLSNNQALELFIQHRPPHLGHLLLSHLSKNNNDPDLVMRLFNRHAGGVQVSVASRYEVGPVYYIQAGNIAVPPLQQHTTAVVGQLSLF